MNYLKKKTFLCLAVRYADKAVSFLMFLAMAGTVLFIGLQVYYLFFNIIASDLLAVLHAVAIIIVLVKAYRLFFFYMESHHVSVKYIVEIAIVAPAVELIFAADNRSLEMNILFALFSLANLFFYLFYYKQLDHIDEDRVEEQDIFAPS